MAEDPLMAKHNARKEIAYVPASEDSRPALQAPLVCGERRLEAFRVRGYGILVARIVHGVVLTSVVDEGE